jgi:hypothetical protein
MRTKFWSEFLKGKNHLYDEDEKIHLKEEDMELWHDLGWGKGPIAVTCEPSGCVNDGELLD